ncbi:MAG: hypothetical protein IKT27_03355 [Clostridia bacterium]|nr:hypothetical protein [Clostridia bacterium]
MNKMKKLIFVAGMTLAVLGTQLIATPVKTANAESVNNEYEIISSLSNASFNSDGSYGLTNPPSSWTAINKKGVATKGVINTGSTFASYQKDTYALEGITNPGTANSSDSHVLMINSKVGTSNSATVSGFKSSTITLDAYSYYSITAYAKTVDATASMHLTGFEDIDLMAGEPYLSNISSNLDAYLPYTFFIMTGFDKIETSLELYLGNVSENAEIASTGVVFFDDIQIKKHSMTNFVAEITNSSSNNSLIGVETYTNVAYENGTFEFGLQGQTGVDNDEWEIIEGDHNNNYSIAVKNDSELGLTNSMLNTKALVLESEDENYIGVKSFDIEILKNHYYRIVLNAKAQDMSGNAYITFNETDVLKEEPHNFTAYEPKSTSLSISSTTENALQNGFNTYEIYIAGHELYDTVGNIELSIGNKDGKASGKIAFDDMMVMNITHDQFKSVTTSSNVASLTLSTIKSDSDINGFFNKAHSDKAIAEYPYIPESWTKESDDNNELSIFGVVNTAEWTLSIPNPYNANRISGDTVIPVPAGTSNNILMVHNASIDSYQTIKSPDLSISSNSFYTLTFNYLAHGNDILNVKIVDNNGNVVYQDLGLASDSWSLYEITINTEYYGSTLNVIFEVGTETDPKQGYAYFDNVQLVQETDYETTYDVIVANGGNIIDFSNNGFNMVGEELESDIFEALMYESNGAEGGIGGIVNDQYPNLVFPSTHTSSVKNMLAINTFSPTDYSLKAKETISLEANKFYKFSVYVKTVFEQDVSSITEDFGAYFSIDGVTDAKISKIKTTDEAGFTLYEIFIKSDAKTDVNVVFGLKSIGAETHGTAFFDTFTYSTIEKSEYTSATDSATLLKVNNVDVSTDEEEEEESTPAGQVNIWIAISTIVMILAMVIAIVGALLRKVEIKKYKVKRQAEYDRKATLVHDSAYAEAEKRRTEQVKELLKEKAKLEGYVAELDEENKQRLSEQRRKHGKEITRSDEKQFKIYASQRQKLIKDVERMDARIKEAQSPEYLMRIMKLVQNEKVAELIEKEKQQSNESASQPTDNEKQPEQPTDNENKE